MARVVSLFRPGWPKDRLGKRTGHESLPPEAFPVGRPPLAARLVRCCAGEAVVLKWRPAMAGGASLYLSRGSTDRSGKKAGGEARLPQVAASAGCSTGALPCRGSGHV